MNELDCAYVSISDYGIIKSIQEVETVRLITLKRLQLSKIHSPTLSLEAAAMI